MSGLRLLKVRIKALNRYIDNFFINILHPATEFLIFFFFFFDFFL